MGKTLYEKIWESHLIYDEPGEPSLIYVDRHLVHEVTSPQAFEGLCVNERKIRHPEKILATVDHCVPTKDRDMEISDPMAAEQINILRKNCKEHQLRFFDLNDLNQGIIHVIAPEQGVVLPGMVAVCGDSHTATHGAFGALAFGVGTSEVEHVFATQTIQQVKSRTMRAHFEGNLPLISTAKDMALAVIGKIGTAGGTGCVIEYTGQAVRNLSMEGRMTLCNMAIESGARAGMIAPDDVTYEYLKSKPGSPTGNAWEKAMNSWTKLISDADAKYDVELTMKAEEIQPQVTWGTSPGQVVGINGYVPFARDYSKSEDQLACQRALKYMGLESGTLITDIPVDVVFIGSCTNGRIEDLRLAASIVDGKRCSDFVQGIVVPGSGLVKKQAEEEGLSKIFLRAGFEWRDPGCSMCLGMNGDVLLPGQRCASTSNRNFEGRQGKGGRTHLVSPSVAASAAIAGRFIKEL